MLIRWILRRFRRLLPLKCREPRLVYDLYDVLPPHGENRSILRVAEGTATLSIEYDGDGGQTGCVSLIFENVSAVVKAGFPGVSLRAFSCEQPPLGGLVEYCASAAADEWTKYRHWSKRRTKHFQLILTEANESFDIFAEGWRVGSADVESGACDGIE